MESSLGSGPRKEGGERMLLVVPLGYPSYLYDQRGIHSITLVLGGRFWGLFLNKEEPIYAEILSEVISHRRPSGNPN
jgi:hypothetical protein